MPRASDSGQLDLPEIFLRVQHEMLAQLAVGHAFEHASTAGAATEHHWLEMFHRYLPKAYRAAPAFIIDSLGRRSRQIDIAIFDHLYSPCSSPTPPESTSPPRASTPSSKSSRPSPANGSATPPIKPPPSATSIAPRLTPQTHPRRTPRRRLRLDPARSSPPTFNSSLQSTPLDIGCCLEYGAFEQTRTLRISSPDESLIFFVLRLLERLRAMGPAPAIDLMQYARGLQSFK